MHAFNPLDHDPSQGTPNWPLGKHPVIIKGSEVAGTKDGANGMLVFDLLIIDGPEKGFVGKYRLNLYHTNEDAVRIAHKQLSAICHVVQTFQLGPDGTQLQYLYEKPFVIEVGLQKGEEAAQKGYTEIKRVFDMDGNEPGKRNQGGQGAPQNNAGQGANPNQGQNQHGGANAWGGNPQGQGNGQGQPQNGQGGGWGGNQGNQGNGGGGNASWGQGGGNGGGSAPADQGNNGGGWQQGQGGNGGSNGGGNGGPSWGQRR